MLSHLPHSQLNTTVVLLGLKHVGDPLRARELVIGLPLATRPVRLDLSPPPLLLSLTCGPLLLGIDVSQRDIYYIIQQYTFTR